MIKTLAFDFDYTLGDSSEGIVTSINYALETMGHEKKPAHEVKKTIGHHLTKAYIMLTGREQPEEGLRFMELFMEKANVIMVDNTVLYPGVLQVLTKIKEKGIKIAIVTTKNHQRIVDILEKYEANDLINVIVGGDDVKAPKPAPEGLLWTMEHLEVTRDELLYIGDSTVDAKTAQAAGVKFAAVLTGTTHKEEFDEYEYEAVCETIAQLYQVLLKDL